MLALLRCHALLRIPVNKYLLPKYRVISGVQYHERPTRSNVGSSSTPGDGPRSGTRTGGASEAAGGVGPEVPEASTSSAIDKERNASVLRIALHLKGARMLVAVASRLDTPTTAAAAAAEAAQSKREAQARRETSAPATACEEENATGEDGMGDLFDEDEVQSPDAEVLPRDWKVTNNAPVYLRNRAAVHGLGVARESSGGGSVNSPLLRRDGNSIYSSTTSPGPISGTPYVRHDSRGGGDRGSGRGGEFPYRDNRRWRQRGGGGGGDESRHDGDVGGHHHHRRRKSGDSSTSVGAANAAEDHNGSWFERGQGQLRWREITQQPFDLMLLMDTGKELGCPRVLLTMPEYGVEDQEKERRKGRSPGGLYICPTMAEYCLLLSVYFGEDTPQGWGLRDGECRCTTFGCRSGYTHLLTCPEYSNSQSATDRPAFLAHSINSWAG